MKIDPITDKILPMITYKFKQKIINFCATLKKILSTTLHEIYHSKCNDSNDKG